MIESKDIKEIDTIIIGNGPSGIVTSFLLSGYLPYFSGKYPQHIPGFHRLKENLAHLLPDQSLIDADLEKLSDGLYGRSNNPVALLFDMLQRPGADYGLEEESCLTWRHEPYRAVEHLVIGRELPGGSWQKMDDRVVTLSYGSWIELPGLSFKEWKRRQRNDGESVKDLTGLTRASVEDVRRYYIDYLHLFNLSSHFLNNAIVTSVKPLAGKNRFEISGYRMSGALHHHTDCKMVGRFRFHCRNLVLATGSYDVASRLSVPGEDLPFVKHSVTALHQCLQRPTGPRSNVVYTVPRCELGTPQSPSCSLLPPFPPTGSASPPVPSPLFCSRQVVLIFGSGLSSADAVLLCFASSSAFAYSAPVIIYHVFRHLTGSAKSTRGVSLGQLSPIVYPDYRRVYSLMTGDRSSLESSKTNCDYIALEGYEVAEFRLGGQVVIRKEQATNATNVDREERILEVNVACVLAGYLPDLGFLPDSGRALGECPGQAINPYSNPFDVNPFSHMSVRVPGLYVVGPLTGDTFVRFAQGGALAVASDIMHIDDDPFKPSAASKNFASHFICPTSCDMLAPNVLRSCSSYSPATTALLQ